MRSLGTWADRLSSILAAILLSTTISAKPALASAVGIDRIVDLQTSISDRTVISGFLTRDDVREQMVSIGVDPTDLNQRVGELSDSEVGVLAHRIDQAPPNAGAVGVFVLTAVVAFVVFTMTDAPEDRNALPVLDQPSERNTE